MCTHTHTGTHIQRHTRTHACTHSVTTPEQAGEHMTHSSANTCCTSRARHLLCPMSFTTHLRQSSLRIIRAVHQVLPASLMTYLSKYPQILHCVSHSWQPTPLSLHTAPEQATRAKATCYVTNNIRQVLCEVAKWLENPTLSFPLSSLEPHDFKVSSLRLGWYEYMLQLSNKGQLVAINESYAVSLWVNSATKWCKGQRAVCSY